MKLVEALRLLNQRAKETEERHVFSLAAGITPLHLKTFLGAEIAQRQTRGAIAVEVGLFGDLLGTLQQLAQRGPEISGTAVVMEWSDLDARLGWRATHGWREDRIGDILNSVARRCDELVTAIRAIAEKHAVAVSLPTVPLPPFVRVATSTGDATQWTLRARLAEFAAQLATIERCRVLDTQWLDERSPLHQRHDPASDLRSGFPYQLEHAAVLASGLASLLKPAAVKKGLITDLDNTLWRGIIGEDGVENVAWDLDHHALGHGLYQEVLASLAESGTLIAVASKNDSSIAERGLKRSDLVVPRDSLFPIEANWGAKSESVARILAAWNIHADAVVFIDDSPTELAEVAQSFPQITCRQFPTGDEAATVSLLKELRDLFGKSLVTAEDKLRVASLKANQVVAANTGDPDEFLAQAEAVITLQWNEPDARTFELINKTNQFNLNGRRWSDAEWNALWTDPSAFVLSVSYSDKYAPLGKIAALVGRKPTSATEPLQIDAWVLSCRAFSRRIEHVMVRALFEQTGCDALLFNVAQTDRNGPLRDTLSELTSSAVSEPTLLTRSLFESTCPSLFAKVESHELIYSRVA